MTTRCMQAEKYLCFKNWTKTFSCSKKNPLPPRSFNGLTSISPWWWYAKAGTFTVDCKTIYMYGMFLPESVIVIHQSQNKILIVFNVLSQERPSPYSRKRPWYYGLTLIDRNIVGGIYPLENRWTYKFWCKSRWTQIF